MEQLWTEIPDVAPELVLGLSLLPNYNGEQKEGLEGDRREGWEGRESMERILMRWGLAVVWCNV